MSLGRRSKPRRVRHPLAAPWDLDPPASGTPPPDLERDVWNRARGRCELSPLTGCNQPGTDLHHRQPQGRINTYANLMLLCRGCHLNLVHGHPRWARHVGALVSRSAELPAEPWQWERWMTVPPRH